MEMASSIKTRQVQFTPVSTANIQIPDMTRDNKQGVPVSVNPSASFPVRL